MTKNKPAKVLDCLFFLAIFLFFLLPPTDPDLGWQLRCGQEIWQGHSFCSHNQFTVLLENYSWPNHHWLYQAILLPLFKSTGLWGLSFANALLISLAFFLFYLAIKNFQLEKQLAILFVSFLGWGIFSFGLRSQILSFLYFNLVLFLIISKRKQTKFLLPFVLLVWANSHGSFLMGLGLIFFFWGEKLFALAVSQKANSLAKKEVLSFSLVFLLATGLTFLNPHGSKIYVEAFRHLGSAHLEKLIAEWVPPILWKQRLILVTGMVAFFLLLLTEKLPFFFRSFLILPFLLLTLKARRHIPLFFTLVFFLFLTSPAIRRLTTKWRKEKLLKTNFSLLLILGLMVFVFVFRLPRTIKANLSWGNYCQESHLNYPCQAIEFLKQQPEKGNLFNRYEWGGFLIWQLPEYKIFVDGRMPAWSTPSGKSPYTIYLETLQTQPGWEEILVEYNIDWILISPNTFMDLKLSPNPGKFGWQEVYRDQRSVIFKKL